MQGEMRVRFLVNKVSKRILYMEAGKDVVDLLLAFLQLPVATIMSMFAGKAGSAALKVGSLSSIYDSLQRMSEASLMVSKDSIMNPPCSNLRLSNKSQQILQIPPAAKTAPSPAGAYSGVFRFSGGCSTAPRRPQTRQLIFSTGESLFGQPPVEEAPAAGYVKDYLSFIVTDDLCIAPASTIESIVLLSKLNVEKISDLDSLECSLTADEALELLKVSFTSTNALTLAFSHKVASSSFGSLSTSEDSTVLPSQN